MTTFYTFFPFYLLGNLHCFGMCGPLAFMLGKHRFRLLFLLGRIAAFTLAGAAAGSFGRVLHHAHIPALTSFLFGGFFLLFGIFHLFNVSFPGMKFLAKMGEPLNRRLVTLALRENKFSMFSFGFMTIALPCGQSLAVFSACALEGYTWGGFLNGLAFSLLTSPALLFAMKSGKWLSKLKKHSPTLIGSASLVIGGLTCCRGAAELGWISHVSFYLPFLSNAHIVMY